MLKNCHYPFPQANYWKREKKEKENGEKRRQQENKCVGAVWVWVCVCIQCTYVGVCVLLSWLFSWKSIIKYAECNINFCFCFSFWGWHYFFRTDAAKAKRSEECNQQWMRVKWWECVSESDELCCHGTPQTVNDHDSCARWVSVSETAFVRYDRERDAA